MILKEEDRSRCIRAVKDKYPGHVVQEFKEQGGCSYTLLVTPSDNTLTPKVISRRPGRDGTLFVMGRDPFIVQVRPAQYAIDLDIALAAKAIYPSLPPSIKALDLKLPGKLHAYEMERMRGTSLSVLLATSGTDMQKRQERLVVNFAAFIAQGWHLLPESGSNRNKRADSPMEDMPSILSQCAGKVGSSIVYRLQKLSKRLPDSFLRQRAKTVLNRIKTMSAYPVVLNHGDLIPSNILVDEQTWEITGLVDWAEAEYLPFGTCLYGLELLLGRLTPTSPSSAQSVEDSSHLDRTPTFIYYDNATHLRTLFWNHVFEVAPDITKKLEEVRTMRAMGVLLWYGYAWDDGKINRVVNEIDDAIEVGCLRTFLTAA